MNTLTSERTIVPEAQPPTVTITDGRTAFGSKPYYDRMEFTDNTPASFPLDSCPQWFSDAVLQGSDASQSPVELTAMSAISAMSLSVQHLVNASVPDSDFNEPCSLYTMTIAAATEGKSAAEAGIFSKIREQELLRKERYATDKIIYDRENKEFVERVVGAGLPVSPASTGGGVDVAANLRNPPQKPYSHKRRMGTATPQAIMKNLGHNCPTMGIVTSEGGMFVGGTGLSAENLSATTAILSDVWSSGSHSSSTVSRGDEEISSARLSICISIQPNKGAEFLRNKDVLDQGFGPRFLVCYPKSKIGMRVGDRSNFATDKLNSFSERLAELMYFKGPVYEGDGFTLKPQPVCWSDEAKDLWLEFFDELENKMAASGEYRPVAAHAARARDNARRIAACFACYDQFRTNASLAEITISAEHWLAGEAIARFSLYEWQRLLTNTEDAEFHADAMHVHRRMVYLFEKGDSKVKSLKDRITGTVTPYMAPGTIRLLCKNGLRAYKASDPMVGRYLKDRIVPYLVDNGLLVDLSDGKTSRYAPTVFDADGS